MSEEAGKTGAESPQPGAPASAQPAPPPVPSVKRNVLVLGVVIAAVALMLWVGVRQSHSGNSGLVGNAALVEVGTTRSATPPCG